MKHTIDILSEVKKLVREKDSLAKIYLYGSRVRGTSNKESDWDILIAFTDNLAGRLKSIEHWFERNSTTTTDEYGFGIVPGQIRYYNGTFEIPDISDEQTQKAMYWTSTLHPTQIGFPISLIFRPQFKTEMKWRHGPQWGFSIRCIKNED